MKLIRWSPLEEMGFLRDQIDKIFEPVSANGHERYLTHNVPVEVTETPSHYRVRLMLAGVDPDKIKLQCAERELSVFAEAVPRELEKDESVHINQFQYGRFSKQLNFHEAINTDKVNAQFEYGILDIVLPKAESAQRRSIEINVKP